MELSFSLHQINHDQVWLLQPSDQALPFGVDHEFSSTSVLSYDIKHLMAKPVLEVKGTLSLHCQ